MAKPVKHGLAKSLELLIEAAEEVVRLRRRGRQTYRHLTQSIRDVQTFIDDECEYINLYGEEAGMGSYDDGHPEQG